MDSDTRTWTEDSMMMNKEKTGPPMDVVLFRFSSRAFFTWGGVKFCFTGERTFVWLGKVCNHFFQKMGTYSRVFFADRVG